MRQLRQIKFAFLAVLLASPGRAVAQDYGVPYAEPVQLFSYEELDNLVAPVALYPDPLLAQVLVAATFSEQVDAAARFVRSYGTAAVDRQPWDVSVRSVAHYPPLLNMLAERMDWTIALGQAYAVQSTDVMDAVQRLRQMARLQGNLQSTAEQTIVVEREVVRIVPAHPRVIYVPVYDPYVIYHRPVFHLSVRARHWSFGIGFPIGAWLNYDCDWYYRRVYYDGWRGGGWRARSRPFITVVNVYVSPRYEAVVVNRGVVHRTVNITNITNITVNNGVHREVKFDHYQREVSRVAKPRGAAPAQARPAEARAQTNLRTSSSAAAAASGRAQPQGRGASARSSGDQVAQQAQQTQRVLTPRNVPGRAAGAAQSDARSSAGVQQRTTVGGGRATDRVQPQTSRVVSPPATQQATRGRISVPTQQQARAGAAAQRPVPNRTVQSAPPAQSSRIGSARTAGPPAAKVQAKSAPPASRSVGGAQAAPPQAKVVAPPPARGGSAASAKAKAKPGTIPPGKGGKKEKPGG